MSTKVPIVQVKMLEKLLFYLGFEAKRQSGSHVFYRHPDGRYTTLPHHGSQDIGRSLTRQYDAGNPRFTGVLQPGPDPV